jgi:hypothetical protein
MLAADAAITVISEAEPIDAVVRLDRAAAGLDEAGHAALLRGMALALGRLRSPVQRHVVLKLDSWHIGALPLFRAAFPATPWVFVYRDPVEVMVSHLRIRGVQTIPDAGVPAFLGVRGVEAAPPEDYIARVLAAVCAAAAAAADQAELVNYAELPNALASRILPHFGITPSAGGLAAMNAAAMRDAKAPDDRFAPDSAAKQAAAGDAVRDAASRWLAAPYARLETLRRARRGGS